MITSYKDEIIIRITNKKVLLKALFLLVEVSNQILFHVIFNLYLSPHFMKGYTTHELI